jgi:transposase
MNREALEALDKESLIRLVLAQAEMIAALTRQVEVLTARVAELEAKLGLPPKTPDNSSLPPSKGQKPSAPAAPKPKAKPHAGSHRPLHPHPTSRRELRAERCQGCGADVSQTAQFACESYDHIEIPPIEPEVTRVTLFGGVCPCCRKRFKAKAPCDLGPGSPFGDNLRAFVIYLRSVQGIALARLVVLLRDLFGLEISEGALVNILDDSRPAFAAQTSLIKARLLSGTALASDETGVRVGKRTGGFGCSTTPRTPCSSSIPTDRRRWSRPSSAHGGPTSGFPTAWEARWAGPIGAIKSVWRI